MERREIVKKAINFGKPPRLPKRFPECNEVDFCDIKILDDRGRNLMGKKKYITDEWGCIWKSIRKGDMGKVDNVLIDEWNKLSVFKPPDPGDPSKYKDIENELRKREDRYVLIFNHFFLFERMHFLVGFNKLFESFYTNYKEVIKLADMIVDYQLGIVKNLSKRYKGHIDGMWVTEDWGTQTNLLISREMWVDIFKPRYKIIIDELNAAEIDLWFHSCGKINNIIGDLIDVGLKVLNTYQPKCLGIEEIGKQFNNKICFETSIDMQQTIFEGNEAIKKEAYDIVKHWSTIDGGLIVTDYHHEIEDTYIQKRKFIKVNKYMCECFNEAFGSYYMKTEG